jgi:hypothetical protein
MDSFMKKAKPSQAGHGGGFMPATSLKQYVEAMEEGFDLIAFECDAILKAYGAQQFHFICRW